MCVKNVIIRKYFSDFHASSIVRGRFSISSQRNYRYLTKQTLQIARPYLRELTGRRMSVGYHFCLSIGLPCVCDPDISRAARKPERHKCRYFTQSDFLKGDTRYEELAITLGMSRSCHSYLPSCLARRGFFHFWRRAENLSGIESKAEQTSANEFTNLQNTY